MSAVPTANSFDTGARPLESEASARQQLKRRGTAIAVIVASMLSLYSCGEDCSGFSSFTDENGLIVLVACDGTSVVVTPTPDTAVSAD